MTVTDSNSGHLKLVQRKYTEFSSKLVQRNRVPILIIWVSVLGIDGQMS